MVIRATRPIKISVMPYVPIALPYLITDPNPPTFDQIVSHDPTNHRRQSDLELGDMLPRTRSMLKEFYAPFNQELAQMMGSDAFLWKWVRCYPRKKILQNASVGPASNRFWSHICLIRHATRTLIWSENVDEEQYSKGLLNDISPYGPLTRYVKLRVVHAPGMSGPFSPPPIWKETAR